MARKVKFSYAKFVLEYYPDAKSVKVDNHVEIINDNKILSTGKNNRCAWISAYKNIK